MTRLLRPRARSDAAPDEVASADDDGRPSPAKAAVDARRCGRSGSQMRAEHVNATAVADDPLAVEAALQARMLAGPDTDGDDGDGGGGGPGMAPLDFAGTGPFAGNPNAQRWVPVGPSVVRLGQADGRPLVTGRISDIQISANGQRIYAASAKGGIWYSGDAGASWDPVGNWANAARGVNGGNLTGLATGALLVQFGATAAQDHVVVGTGELNPAGPPQTQSGSRRVGGVGILSALGPATWRLGNPMWQVDTGTAAAAGPPAVAAQPNAFFQLGVYRLVRKPGALAGVTAAGTTRDVIVACTSNGAFVGAAVAAGGYLWRPITGTAGVAVTDAVWISTGPPGTDRLFLTRQGNGVDFYDDIVDPTVLVAANPTFNHTPNQVLTAPAVALAHQNRASLATNDNGSVVYVLGQSAPATAAVWQIRNPTAAIAAVRASAPIVSANMTNARLWGNSNGYAHGFAASGTGAGNDQLFIGGTSVNSPLWGSTTPNGGTNAALWAFNIAAGVGAALNVIPGVSDAAARVDRNGLIGNNVHADVHEIRVQTAVANNASFTIVGNLATLTVNSTTGMHPGDVVTVAGTGNALLDQTHVITAVAAATISFVVTSPDLAATPVAGTATVRRVWVGCDGGIYRSLQGGAAHTFLPRHTGVAVIEAGYVANHPTSRQYAMLGAQDNGVMMRVGETIWEMIMFGDGGGVAFHPTAPQDVIGQFIRGAWRVKPLRAGAPNFAILQARRLGARLTMVPNNAASATFYSGVDANGQRIALGTNRVYLADAPLIPQNIANWRVLPFGGAPAAPVAVAASAAPPGALGMVHTVKWINNNSLVALYSQAVVLYTEAPPGQWTGAVVLPIPGGGRTGTPVIPTDIAPVPGLNAGSVYLTTATRSVIPDPNTGAMITDTAFLYNAGTNTLSGLGLDQGAGNPIDPASSVVVDQPPGGAAHVVYVGTTTGVQRRTTQAAPPGFNWTAMVNGTPDTTVQDMAIWTDPGGAPAAPRLLRAALQSRGIWELDLNAATEPEQTYLRVHTWDARRQLPTPMQNPRRSAAAAALPFFDSPDIVVRPDVPAAPPLWPGVNIAANNAFSRYQLWTFQTAFRWHWPSVVADGRLTDAFTELVTRERTKRGIPGTTVNQALWNAIVGSRDNTGRLYVYRAPWTDDAHPTIPASEVDLADLVLPYRASRGQWRVYREPSIVEVLLHHRDTRPIDPAPPVPLAPHTASATLLWRSAPTEAELVGLDTTFVVPFMAGVVGTGPAQAIPANWNVVDAGGGNFLHNLTVPLSARMPRAVSIPLDLTLGGGPGQVPLAHRFVLLIAVASSTKDQLAVAPAGATDTPENLVRNWPYAAARIIRIRTRP